jgi:anti-sigma regulatory factor (Ser/Thr protein kinase)
VEFELLIENRLSEMRQAHHYLDELVARRQLPAKSATDIQVALEEHLSNIIHHGYPPGQSGRISIRFHLTKTHLRVEITDDARPFNPLLSPPVDTTQPTAERPVGGLGIHLLRRLTDELRYERLKDGNCLLMVKRLPTGATGCGVAEAAC